LIKDMNEKQDVNGIFCVETASLEITKSNKPYLLLRLISEESETVVAKFWDVSSEDAIEFTAGTYIVIEGITRKWRNNIEVTIKKLRKATEDEKLTSTSVSNGNTLTHGTFLQNYTEILNTITEKEQRLICEYCFTKVEDKISTHSTWPDGNQITLLKKLLNLVGEYMDESKLDVIRSAILIHNLASVGCKDINEDKKTRKGKLLGTTGIALEMVTEAVIFCGLSLEEENVIELKHVLTSLDSTSNCTLTVTAQTAVAIIQFSKNINGVSNLLP